MGRALFSTLYAPKVAVHTQPDLPSGDFPKCERWSIANPFDPDSDEFYENATREVFTDTEAWRAEQEAVRQLLADQARGSSDSPTSSEASGSDTGSPMAEGSDDPAVLIANAYSNAQWPSRWTNPGEDWVLNGSSNTEQRSRRRVSRQASIGFIPPESFLTDLVAADTAAAPVSPPQSPSTRRTVNVTPISIPNEPSSPSLISPASPTTPTDRHYPHEMVSLLTPSPPPSVTPQVYNWYRAPLAVSQSPLAGRGSSAGPLTNPDARLSLARLNVVPSRVQVQNAVI
ncbi:hypothetical protein H0H92_005412 [Tricholoma furcatifolium]|nr:hypothetical protein H0H92_005412 [Tricholoma furcatifolium]